MKTDKELKEIAMAIRAGTIFTDRNIKPEDQYLAGSIFIPLLLMDEKGRKELVDSKPGMIYQYMSEAGPRSVNGYPCFFNMRILSQEEMEKVLDYFKKIEEVFEKI